MAEETALGKSGAVRIDKVRAFSDRCFVIARCVSNVALL